MTERSGPRGPKGPSRSNAGRGKRPGGDSRGSGSRGKGEQGPRSRSGRPETRSGSRDGRGSSDSRGGSRDGRGSSDSRGGSRDGRGSRDDRGGSRGRGRDDRDGRGSRDSRDDRGSRGGPRGRGGDDRGGRDGTRGPRTRVGRYNDAPPAEAGSKSWGGLARQGAARIKHDPWDDRDDIPGDEREEEYERTPEEQAKYEERMAKRELGERNRERLRAEAQAAIARSGPKAPPKVGPTPVRDRPALVPRKIPDPKRHLIELLGESHGKRAWRDLNIAAEHLDAGRTSAAKPMLNRLYRQASGAVEVAETYGLLMYALGKWHDAIEVLEDVRVRTGQPDQNPVLADAHRAVGNWADVSALWEELRDMSPASELVVEGRIVAAGALADQGELGSAVRLLSKGWKRPKRPQEHHLRRGYALADLYERAGEGPRAKELFGWVAHHEPDFVDAKHRST